MRVVGLTGGIGCGKTAVSDAFAALGAGVIDTDVIAHRLTGPGAAGSRAVADVFGERFLRPDGSLDRAAMRERVFSQPQDRARLEGLLHPLILDEALDELRRIEAPYAVLVVPLLAGSPKYRALCDRILVVDCPEALQIERVTRRSGLTEDEVRKIIQVQASRAERLAIADDVLQNSDGIEALQARVAALHQHYLTLTQLQKNRG